MKYFSIDIETSGLSPIDCSVLSVGAVFEDSNTRLSWEHIPKFHFIARLNDGFFGEIQALRINAGLLDQMGKCEEYARGLKEYNNPVNVTELLTECPNLLPSIYGPIGSMPRLLQQWMHACEEGTAAANYDGSLESTFYKFDKFHNNNKPARINVAGKNFGTFDKRFLEQIKGFTDLVKIRHKIIDPGCMFIDWDKDEVLPGLDECKRRAGCPGIVTHNAVEDAWDVLTTIRSQYPAQKPCTDASCLIHFNERDVQHAKDLYEEGLGPGVIEAAKLLLDHLPSPSAVV